MHAHLVYLMGVKCKCTHEVTNLSDVLYENADYCVRCRETLVNE
jgi:hypothetical protein